MTEYIDPDQYIITRKRKKYKFALFANSPLCFEAEEWVAQDFQPTILEVGAGTGLFSAELAQQFPKERVVACDVKADRLVVGAREFEQQSPKGDGSVNIRFLRAHGQQLPDLITPHSLKTIWLTFPDPFPKKRAAKHRLTHHRYLELYKTLLAPDGSLYFKTDNHDLFDWSIEELIQHGWYIDQLTYDLHASKLSKHYKIQTSYEARFLAEGLPTHFLRANIENLL